MLKNTPNKVLYRMCYDPDSNDLKLRERKAGFALVVALSLMAFILLLVISLTTVVRVETTVSSQQMHQLEAESNARLALSVALGELQKAAGPDQRVTARADIVGNIESTGDDGISYAVPENPYYTLVWDVSGSEGNDPGERPGHDFDKQPTILVSGNEQLEHDNTNDTSYPGNYTTEATVLNDSDSVLLVSAPEDLSNSNLEVGVRAPIVEFEGQNGRVGEYAWVVLDENIKARVNLSAPDESEVENWRDVATAGPQTADPLTVEADLTNLVGDQLPRTFGFDTLAAASQQNIENEEARSFFHDFSFASTSLYTDVKNGGLKKDLSFGLDDGNLVPPSEISDDTFLIERDRILPGDEFEDAESAANLNFAQWGVLRDYYNLRRPNDVSFAARPNRPEDNEYASGIHPILTHFQLGVYADYEGPQITVDGETSSQVRLRLMPAVVLWNPYSFDLSFDDLYVATKGGRQSGGFQPRVEFDTDPDNLVRVVSNFGAVSFVIPSGRIESGRAVIYTAPDGGTQFEVGGTFFVSNANNRLERADNPKNFFVANAEWFEMEPDPTRPGQFRRVKDVNDNDVTTPLVVPVVQPPAPQPQIRFSRIDNRSALDILLAESDGGSLDRESVYQGLYGLPVNFPRDAGEPNFYIPSITNDVDPVALAIYGMAFGEVGMHFLDEDTPPIAWNGLFNPRAQVLNAASNALPYGYDHIQTFRSTVLHNANEINVANIPSASGFAFVGTTPNGNGSDRAVLYDLPTNPLYSIGQLSHANILSIPSANYGRWSDIERAGGQRNGLQAANLAWSGGGLQHTPSYVIGSSQANPFIQDLTETTFFYNLNTVTQEIDSRNDDRNDSRVWDFSYLFNEVLFDEYFFSTIEFGSSDPEFSRIQGDANDLVNQERFSRVAERLHLEGGFNINSTSVGAWASFLASLRDEEPLDFGDEEGSLFSRFEAGEDGLITEFGHDEDDSQLGYRKLSDDAIFDLAEKIVEQVKLRGPFPSMSAFVNRVLEPTSLRRDIRELTDSAPDPTNSYSGDYDLELMAQLKGVLHAAVELSSANEDFHDNANGVVEDNEVTGIIGSNGRANPSSKDTSFEDTKGFVAAIGASLPGYLSQVDILSGLGHLMTPRSDTFTIRVQGQSRELSGEVAATAYGEAVVRRTINFVDETDEPNEQLTSLSSENGRFGRRFEVVRFRWLEESEI